jgi:hypothetical protein
MWHEHRLLLLAKFIGELGKKKKKTRAEQFGKHSIMLEVVDKADVKHH